MGVELIMGALGLLVLLIAFRGGWHTDRSESEADLEQGDWDEES